MGTTFRLVFYAPSDSIADIAARQSFDKVEEFNAIFSDYKADSELNKLSERSGSKHWIPVSPPLYDVLKRSVQIARATDGAFDITVGPYVKLWRNLANQYNPQRPSKDTLQALGRRVGYRKILFNDAQRAVKLRAGDMQLDLGGIAKGYTADNILKVLQNHGIESALVDAGGDITAGNAPPEKSGWTITIPCYLTADKTGIIQLSIANKAVASSGDLFQHIIIDGTRYSHIVDPRTGLGVTNQTTTSVIAPNGATADAFASALSVMHPQDAILRAKNDPELHLNINYLRSDTIARKAARYFRQLRCKE